MSSAIYDTDQQLLSGLQAGKEAAFTAIYHRYYQRVFYFAQRYVGDADAQDVTAEAFIQVWNRRTGFEAFSSLARFLFITVRNRCYDISRRQQVKHARAAELAQLMEHVVPPEPFADHQLRAALVELLDTHIHRLPQRVHEVFLLSFRDGLKPAQIAERLGISVKTVKNQKLSAIAILKAAIADHPLQLSLLLLLLQMESGR